MLSTVLSSLVVAFLPRPVWPVWLVLTTVGALTIAVDDAVRFLPKRLTHVGTGAMLLALVVGATLGHMTWLAVGQALVGALAVRSLLWCLWRLIGTMGFGDVRLAAMCGLAAATGSFNQFLGALLAASVMPIITALIRYRGHRQFPYGPGLVLGALLGAALLA